MHIQKNCLGVAIVLDWYLYERHSHGTDGWFWRKKSRKSANHYCCHYIFCATKPVLLTVTETRWFFLAKKYLFFPSTDNSIILHSAQPSEKVGVFSGFYFSPNPCTHFMILQLFQTFLINRDAISIQSTIYLVINSNLSYVFPQGTHTYIYNSNKLCTVAFILCTSVKAKVSFYLKFLITGAPA